MKPGYKQTEVGVIPIDWDVCCLDDLGDLEMGKGLLKSDISLFGDLPAIPYTSLYTDFSEVIEPRGINWFTSRLNAYYVANSPCVLLASSSNVSANTGKACALVSGFPIAIGREVISFRTQQNVAFISYLLGTKPYRKKTLNLAKGITIRHVYPTTFIGYKIALPSLVEQSVIASALGDVNLLISGLDKLIAKKYDIQQSAMQQLLTGQRRLPGFNEEWGKTCLGGVVERFVGGGTPSRNVPEYWSGDIPWITVKDFATFNPWTSQEHITLNGLKSSASSLIPAGTLITSTRMALGKAVIYQVDVTINQDLKALFIKPSLHVKFLYYWFKFKERVIDELGSGSTVKGLSLADLRSIPFQLPSVEEQKAIATILSDMDTEITALEARRDKARQLKQGMMQELLTGRIRLV